MLLEPKQVFQQVILSIDQHRIIGTNAASMAQYSRGRAIAGSHRSQVQVDQRLYDAFARFSIARCPRGIPGYGGQAEDPAGDNRSRRRVPVAPMNASIVEAVPPPDIPPPIPPPQA